MPDPIRVLIADDHTIFRSGLKLLLSAEPDIEVVGEATDGGSALTMAEKVKPDVVLMDIGMPGVDGFQATRELRQRLPEISILVLTMHRSEEYSYQMLEMGASGHILKGADPSESINAVRAVARGGVFLYPSMARRLVQEYLRQSNLDTPGQPKFTPREREILKLIAEGYTNTEIAERLVVSPSTVHSHRSNLIHKLGLSTRHDLVQYARRQGLIPNS
ncbi:MAG: response regulator transcription factor [Candidatus Bipolaricaulota bacterium]